MTSEICVVGGGPAGLAAALALTQAGREVTVLDCAAPPIDKACGEGLMPDSLMALASLGVDVAHLGKALQGIRFFDGDASVSADFPNGIGRGLRRLILHEILMARAERMGIQMHWGVKNVQSRRGRVSFSGGHIDTRLIVGADGLNSSVRQQAGLDSLSSQRRRYGFRKHYRIPPWSPYVEIYWGSGFQIYVTPVDSTETCVALLSSDPHFRLDAALTRVPPLASRLKGAIGSTERGSLSLSRRFNRVHCEGYILLGDASGSVDAITGQGMCLAFQQSAALVTALDAGDLNLYARAHRKIQSNPLRMAALMLMLGSNRILQRKVIAALSSNPGIFRSLLAMHVVDKPLADIRSWQVLGNPLKDGQRLVSADVSQFFDGRNWIDRQKRGVKRIEMIGCDFRSRR